MLAVYFYCRPLRRLRRLCRLCHQRRRWWPSQLEPAMHSSYKRHLRADCWQLPYSTCCLYHYLYYQHRHHYLEPPKLASQIRIRRGNLSETVRLVLQIPHMSLAAAMATSSTGAAATTSTQFIHISFASPLTRTQIWSLESSNSHRRRRRGRRKHRDCHTRCAATSGHQVGGRRPFCLGQLPAHLSFQVSATNARLAIVSFPSSSRWSATNAD